MTKARIKTILRKSQKVSPAGDPAEPDGVLVVFSGILRVFSYAVEERFEDGPAGEATDALGESEDFTGAGASAQRPTPVRKIRKKTKTNLLIWASLGQSNRFERL
jgi:hypothetical protein